MVLTKRYNWMAVAVSALALINLATLAFFWLNKPGPEGPPPREARDRLVRDLDLNRLQAASFDSLRQIHFSLMNQYRAEMKQKKDELFGRLRAAEDSSYVEITAQIGNLQARIDQATFLHFQALRQLCDDRQKEKFDRIIQDVLHHMAPERKRE